MPDLSSGFSARKSGLLVKGDLALESDVNPQFPWQIVNQDNSETRGVDTADQQKARRLQKIETSRKTDPLLFRGIDYYDKLGVGVGFSLSAAQGGEELLTAAERAWEFNNIDEGQHQASNELVTSGNLYGRVPTKFDGDVPLMQMIPSSQIERIATKDGVPWYYRRKWTDYVYREPQTGPQSGRGAIAPTVRILYEDIPAEEMVHIAINRTAQELRGTSMLEPAIYWSSKYGRWLDTQWETAVARSIIANHITVDGGDQVAVDKSIDQIEKNLVNRVDSNGSTFKSMAPAQVLCTGKEVEIKSISSALTAGSSTDESRDCKLMAAVAMGVPEFILSDGQKSNRATAQIQSDPYFRMIESHQNLLIKFYQRMLRLVFDRFQAKGQFASVAPPKRKFHVSDWVTVHGPDLLSPEVETLGPVAVALVDAGIWSRQYANEKLGSDWEDMKLQITAEKEGGFEKAPAQQGNNFPPSSTANRNQPSAQLPLGLEADATRTETDTPTEATKKITRKMLARFTEEARASKGDEAKIKAAGQKVLEEARLQMFDLIDKTRAMGVGSMAA